MTTTLTASDANTFDGRGGFATRLCAEIRAGIGLLTITEWELINTLSYSATYVAANSRENTGSVCLTANEVLATGSSDELIGRNADVFLGGAINFNFGISNILKYDSTNCSYFIDKGLLAAQVGMPTTYVYQRYDIENVVIPNLLLSERPAAASSSRSRLRRRPRPFPRQ